MTQEQLYDYLRHPAKLDAATLPEIKALLESYPYCGSFMFLYLYNMAVVRDVRYASELRRLAPLMPNRKRLYRAVMPYLKPTASAIEDVGSVSNQDEPQDPFILIEDFLDEMQASGADLPDELTYSGSYAGSADYFADLRTNRKRLSDRSIDATKEETPLLLQHTKGLQPGDLIPSDDQADLLMLISEGRSDASKSDDIEESLFTETLAKIYIKQGRYDKALRIIRSLSLNYPQKNAYFADQMRYLEKLIDNEKQI